MKPCLQWEQTTLLPPTLIEMTVVCHIVGPQNAVGITMRLVEGASGELGALSATVVDLGDEQLREVSRWFYDWLSAAVARTSPF